MTTLTELLQNAIDDPSGTRGRQAGYHHVFDRGDLRQMAAQREFLLQQGFEVGSVNAFPAVKTEEDFRRALALIWNNKVDGWWHYQDRYTHYGICTEANFDAALNH